LKNSGTDTSSPVNVSVTDKSFKITSNQCAGMSLAPESSCTVSVAFSPDTIGPKTGALTAQAGTQMASAALTGTATLPATLSIMPSSHNFGDVPINAKSASFEFTVSNDGDVDAPKPTVSTTGEF